MESEGAGLVVVGFVGDVGRPVFVVGVPVLPVVGVPVVGVVGCPPPPLV